MMFQQIGVLICLAGLGLSVQAQNNSYCFSNEAIKDLNSAAFDQDASGRARAMVFYTVADKYFSTNEIQMTRHSSYELALAYRLSKLANDLHSLKDASNSFKRISAEQQKYIELRYEELIDNLNNASSHIYQMDKSGYEHLKSNVDQYRTYKAKWEICAIKK